MRVRSTNSTGFTMIELIVVTTVVGILSAIIFNFLSNQIVANAVANARAKILHEAQLALDIVSRDIKHAAGVDDINRWEDDYSPGAPGNLLSWQPGSEVLVLATPAKDTDSGFLYEDPFAYITHKNNLIYFLENGTLYKRTLAADIPGNATNSTCPASVDSCPNDIALINNVTGLDIRYFDANDDEVAPDEARSVQVGIVISDNVYRRQITVEYQIRSVFRNE